MLIIVGPFPPPVHGASAVTEVAARQLNAAGFQTICCNILPPASKPGILYHLDKAVRYTKAVMVILSAKRSSIIYMPLSGGFGLLYDAFVVLAARLRGLPCVFHHHSFAYLTVKSHLLEWIVRLSGARQRHIVLCESMRRLLHLRYGAGLTSQVISNLAFIEMKPADRHPRARPGTLGYLSNVSLEKGIDRFFDLVAGLQARGVDIQARIAGPFARKDDQQYVENRLKTINGVTYVGPVYAAAKTDFLNSIDMLVFPTRYVNEAAPLVIYEAQLAGLPVATTARGCLGDMTCDPDILLDSKAQNLDSILDTLEQWSQRESVYRDAQHHANARVARFSDIGQRDSGRFREFIATASKAER